MRDLRAIILTGKEVNVRVKPGDRIFCLSAGGGGFGDPQSRPPAQRAWDVQNGYCSGAQPPSPSEER